jgi:uncharacterized oligopeptide transporter (OPT) family protein
MRLRFLVVFVLFLGLVAFAQTTIFSDNMTNFPTGWRQKRTMKEGGGISMQGFGGYIRE